MNKKYIIFTILLALIFSGGIFLLKYMPQNTFAPTNKNISVPTPGLTPTLFPVSSKANPNEDLDADLQVLDNTNIDEMDKELNQLESDSDF